MNYIIENKLSVTGIVQEVHDDYIIVYSETADGYPNGSNWSISLNDVIILSQNGYKLTWSDFEQYKYVETGSGLYIRFYEINDLFSLWIGGSNPDSGPRYIYLALTDDMDTRIDIRDGGVTEFISEHNSNTN